MHFCVSFIFINFLLGNTRTPWGDAPWAHLMYTVSQKTSHLWFANFDTREYILIFFGRNITDKVSNQNMLYCATSNNVCLCSCATWQNGETRKYFFSLKCFISALPEFNQSLLDFFSLLDSWLILTLLHDSLNLIISAFSSGLLWGMAQEKGRRERCSSLTLLNAQCMCTSVVTVSKCFLSVGFGRFC